MLAPIRRRLSTFRATVAAPFTPALGACPKGSIAGNASMKRPATSTMSGSLNSTGFNRRRQTVFLEAGRFAEDYCPSSGDVHLRDANCFMQFRCDNRRTTDVNLNARAAAPSPDQHCNFAPHSATSRNHSDVTRAESLGRICATRASDPADARDHNALGIGANYYGIMLTRELPEAYQMMDRDALRAHDYEPNSSAYRLDRRFGDARARYIAHANHVSMNLNGCRNCIVDRNAVNVLSSSSRRDSRRDPGARIQHPFRLQATLAPGYALNK